MSTLISSVLLFALSVGVPPKIPDQISPPESAANRAPVFHALPTPLPMPEGSLDDAAAYFAEKVARCTPDSGSALVSGLQACGFSIIDKDRRVLLKPLTGKGNGMSFYDFEVINMLNFGPGAPMTQFKSFGDMLSPAQDTQKAAQLHQSLVDCLREGLKSKIPETDFLCHFLDDLSQYGPGGWSITGSSSTRSNQSIYPTPAAGTPFESTQEFNAAASLSDWAAKEMAGVTQEIQAASANPQAVSAVVQKMPPLQQIRSAAAIVQAKSLAGQAAAGQGRENRLYANKPFSAIQTQILMRQIYLEYYGRHGTALRQDEAHGPALSDDPPPDYTGNVMDAAANPASWAFQQLLNQLDIGSVATKAEKVGAVGGLVKALLMLMATEITLDPADISLVRQKDMTAGTPLKLTLTVKINFKHGTDQSTGNTARVFGWVTGYDSNLAIVNGTVSGAQVEWTLLEPNQILDPSIWFVSPGQAGDGQIKISDQTDSQGQVKSLAIQTAPQKVNLPPTAVSFQRNPTLYAAVTLKGSNLPDLLAQATANLFAAATGGGIPGAIKGVIETTVSDMLMRQSLLTTESFPIKVTDWTVPVCTGTFHLKISGTGKASDAEGGVSSFSIDESAEGDLNSALMGLTKTEALAKLGQGPYMLHVKSIRDVHVHDQFVQSVPDDGCLRKSKTDTTTTTIGDPTAQMPFGYSLDGGGLTIKLVHQDGKDQVMASADTGFSLPCRCRTVSPGQPSQDTIQYVNLPLKDIKYFPPNYDSKLSGLLSQEIPFQFGLAKGIVKCEMVFEIHPIKSQ